MTKAKDVLKHELIGLEVEVMESRNESQKGIRGIVTDETKNMLIISQNKSEKKVYKSQSRFKFTLPNGQQALIDGELINARPEERLKKTLRKTRW